MGRHRTSVRWRTGLLTEPRVIRSKRTVRRLGTTWVAAPTSARKSRMHKPQREATGRSGHRSKVRASRDDCVIETDRGIRQVILEGQESLRSGGDEAKGVTSLGHQENEISTTFNIPERAYQVDERVADVCPMLASTGRPRRAQTDRVGRPRGGCKLPRGRRGAPLVSMLCKDAEGGMVQVRPDRLGQVKRLTRWTSFQ